VSARTFFATLIVCRLLRFGGEALLANIYGRRIIGWLESDLFHDIVAVFIALAAVLTTMSIVKIVRTSARRPARRAPV
jgi:hypothetical protein